VELVLTEEETEVLKAMVKLEEELLNGIRVKLASAVPLSS